MALKDDKKTAQQTIDTAKQTLITHLNSKNALQQTQFLQFALWNQELLNPKLTPNLKKTYFALLAFAKRHAPKDADKLSFFNLEVNFRKACLPLLQKEADFADEKLEQELKGFLMKT